MADDHQNPPVVVENVKIREVLCAAMDIATVLVGSGVLTLPWSLAQLGWIVGLIVLLIFVSIATISGWILAGTYEVPGDEVKRGDENDPNWNYSGVVKRIMGGKWKAFTCRCFVYATISGTCIVYAITVDSSFRSVVNVPRVYCMIVCCFVQVVYCLLSTWTWLSTRCNKCSWLTTLVSCLLCLSYPLIGSAIAITEIIVRGTVRGGKFGNPRPTRLKKLARFCMAVANVGFSFNYVIFAFQIQASIGVRTQSIKIKSMRVATIVGLIFTAILYGAFASLFYVAFGDDSPPSIFSNSTHYHLPKWVLGVANICVVLHLIGDYKEYSFLAFESYERYFKLKSWWLRHLIRAILITGTYFAAYFIPKFFLWFGVVSAISFFPLCGLGPVAIYLKQRNQLQEENIRIQIECWRKYFLFVVLAVTLIMTGFLAAGAAGAYLDR